MPAARTPSILVLLLKGTFCGLLSVALVALLAMMSAAAAQLK
jgi:hypothetical protein